MIGVSDRLFLQRIWGRPWSVLSKSDRRKLDAIRRGLSQPQVNDALAFAVLAYVDLLTNGPSSLDYKRYLRRAARSGEPASQLQLAMDMMKAGRNREAMRWLRRSAGSGLVEAVFWLGLALVSGDITRRNIPSGIEALRRAHRLGHRQAAGWLGWAYDNIEPPRPAVAFSWYEKAARYGEPIAMNNLGAALENGDGVRANLRRAQRWYARAARLGVKEAKLAVRRVEEKLASGPDRQR